MQLRVRWWLSAGNSLILVPPKFRVVKLTKALKPEKSAQKRMQVSAQASDIRIFALTASAIRCNCSRFRRRSVLQVAISRPRARARTLERVAPRELERHEGGAFGERFKRPWEEQWAKGPDVLVNLHWWSRRSNFGVTYPSALR